MRTVEDITKLDVTQFLPQRPPFVLVDKLLQYDEATTAVKTHYRIPHDAPFVEGERFQTAGIMEHIAQSCATRIGYYDWLHENEIKIGVIGEVKDMKVYYHPKAGDELITVITPKSEIMGVLLATAVVKDPMMNLIATCTIKIAI